jgi:hypothetical protein
MKYTTILLFAFLIQISVSCQPDTTVVPFSARWKVGDNENYKVTKVKKTWQSRKLVQNDSIQYIADFTIIDADTISYTIRWKLKNPLLEGFKLSESAFYKLAKAYDSTTVIYSTNRHGAFLEIKNWKEISVMVTDMINEMIRLKSAESTKDPEELKKAYMPVLSVYSSKRGIEQLVFKELLMFHFPFGNQYTKGEYYNYVEKLPVMQNTGPANGNGIVFIRKSDHKEKTCELVQRMKILPDSARDYLVRYFNVIGILPGAIESTLKASKLEINDNNIYQYQYDPGLPLKITVARETLIDVLDDKIKQIDQTVIERISD